MDAPQLQDEPVCLVSCCRWAVCFVCSSFLLLSTGNNNLPIAYAMEEEEEEETDATTETMVNDYNVSDASQSTTTSTSAPLNPSSFD